MVMTAAADFASDALGFYYKVAFLQPYLSIPGAVPNLVHADMGYHVADGKSGGWLCICIFLRDAHTSICCLARTGSILGGRHLQYLSVSIGCGQAR